jgi:hypothetical protein
MSPSASVQFIIIPFLKTWVGASAMTGFTAKYYELKKESEKMGWN